MNAVSEAADALPAAARPADKAEAYAIQNEVARRIGPVRQPLTLDIDGKRVVDVVGGSSAGDTVTTGSCTGTIFIAPGSRAVADFPGLGRIELTVA